MANGKNGDWEVDENGRVQHTDILSPTKTFNTQYGVVTGADWLQLEKERMEAKGGDCEIKTDKLGRVSLWVVPVPKVKDTGRYNPGQAKKSL